MKIAKQDMKRVLDALQQLNEVRLERIRELIRQRNGFQQEVITLRAQLDDPQGDQRLARWRQRWVALRDENKVLRQELETLRQAQLTGYGYTQLAKDRAKFCLAERSDNDSGDTDPHWCDKSPDHAEFVDPSPHRCGDCKKEWVS